MYNICNIIYKGFEFTFDYNKLVELYTYEDYITFRLFRLETLAIIKRSPFQAILAVVAG